MAQDNCSLAQPSLASLRRKPTQKEKSSQAKPKKKKIAETDWGRTIGSLLAWPDLGWVVSLPKQSWPVERRAETQGKGKMEWVPKISWVVPGKWVMKGLKSIQNATTPRPWRRCLQSRSYTAHTAGIECSAVTLWQSLTALGMRGWSQSRLQWRCCCWRWELVSGGSPLAPNLIGNLDGGSSAVQLELVVL